MKLNRLLVTGLVFAVMACKTSSLVGMAQAQEKTSIIFTEPHWTVSSNSEGDYK